MRFLIRQGQLGTTKKLLSLRSIGAKGRLSLIHMDRIINIAMGLWHVGLLIPTGAYCAGFILSFKREPRALRHIAWLAKELLGGMTWSCVKFSVEPQLTHAATVLARCIFCRVSL